MQELQPFPSLTQCVARLHPTPSHLPARPPWPAIFVSVTQPLVSPPALGLAGWDISAFPWSLGWERPRAGTDRGLAVRHSGGPPSGLSPAPLSSLAPLLTEGLVLAKAGTGLKALSAGEALMPGGGDMLGRVLGVTCCVSRRGGQDSPYSPVSRP